MSSSAKDGPSAPAPVEKRRSFNKYLTRMKTVLRRSDSKRSSVAGQSPVPIAESEAGPSKKSEPEVKETLQPVSAPQETEDVTSKRILRSQIHAERAKRLGERFAMSIEPLQFKDDIEVTRVEKPIRMRIHRTCHKCETPFGGSKVCAKCQHTRCKGCPRYPAKKTETVDKGKRKEIVPGDYLEPDPYWEAKDDYVLTMPSRRAGGQPLVRKAPKQRVRRYCHECNVLFLGKSKTCTGCGHVRCTDCPRDPAKKNKYPDGYPGDAFSSDTSKPIKYACSDCNKAFPPVPHPDSEAGRALAADATAEKQKCSRCSHERCSKCLRAPPRRIEPAVNPDVLKSVEAKLAALSVAS